MQTIIPTYAQIDQIQQLNHKYQVNHLTPVQKQSGFIRIEYDRESLQRIIDSKEIVIVMDNDKVVGYYLIDRKSNNPTLDYQISKAVDLFETDAIKFEKIGYGAQAVIEATYRGQNILKLMLSKLIEILDNKYSVLFSSVTKINGVALSAHTKGGYKVLSEDETKYYVGLYIAEL